MLSFCEVRMFIGYFIFPKRWKFLRRNLDNWLLHSIYKFYTQGNALARSGSGSKTIDTAPAS